MFKKLSLELGGKNATIILEDADFISNIDKIAKDLHSLTRDKYVSVAREF